MAPVLGNARWLGDQDGQRTLDAAVHDGFAKLMKGVQVTHLLLDEEAEMMTFLAVHSDVQAASGLIVTLNVI